MNFNNKVIFIIGNSRSGTTMMSRILGRNKKEIGRASCRERV